MYGLKLITAPAAEPILVADNAFDEYARIDGAASDNNLTALIREARVETEKFLNRALITQTWELTFDKWPVFPFRIPMAPLISVSSVKYFDSEGTENTWATTEYIVDTDSEPGRIALDYGKTLPNTTLKPINAIKVRFDAGYGDAGSDVPDNFILAMKLYVTHRFEYPESQDVPQAFYNLLNYDRVVPL